MMNGQRMTPVHRTAEEKLAAIRDYLQAAVRLVPPYHDELEDAAMRMYFAGRARGFEMALAFMGGLELVEVANDKAGKE